ncbi:MAG TPA: hypothetical protein DEB40_13010 [Elusimicrobia bacterium]|nr:hypothetical protein [Elusimicrobiota bacterium]HBT62654.1 hypothetical protein [Elusimicrobiota bacterium]
MPDNEQDVEIDLARYFGILSRRKWIVLSVAASAMLGTAAYAFLATPIYRASTLLDIEPVAKAIRSETESGRDMDEEYADTQHRLITSNTLLERVYNDLDLASTGEFSKGLKILQASVSVAPIPNTHLCYVHAESMHPALATNISTTLSRYYVEQNLNSQLFMSKDVLDALQMKTNGADSVKVSESLPTVVNNRLIQSIKEQIFTAEAQLTDLRMKYTDSHPAVIAMRSRIESMKKVQLNEIDNIVRSLKTDLSGQLQGNNVRVVDPARLPDRPIRPKKLLVIIFGILGGAFLGAFAAVFIEFLDQTVRTQDDVEKRMKVPFLGTIPHCRHKKHAKIFEPLVSGDVSLTSEAFRNLRTMIGYSGSTREDASFLVTSTVQSEGKSYVATGLGVVLAQLGQKVLIVDGDLRRPRQHRHMGSSAERGLSDYLSGAVRDPAELLQETGIPALDVITCGPRPPNPAELLNTDKLEALAAWARQRYARVVIDCTPVFPISDAMLWGRVVKSAVFVVRFGRTRLPLIQTAIRRLEGGGLKVLGGVINGARLSTMSYADGRYYEQYYRDYTDTEPPQSRKS